MARNLRCETQDHVGKNSILPKRKMHILSRPLPKRRIVVGAFGSTICNLKLYFESHLVMTTQFNTKDQLIASLQLRPHPEGGFYRESYRAEMGVVPNGAVHVRSASTAIYYLLCDGAHSA